MQGWKTWFGCMAIGCVGVAVLGAGCASQAAHETKAEAIAGSPRAWAGALFAPGATQTYAVTLERMSVTPEAAERGGPTDPKKDWETEKTEGTVTCRVDEVKQFGDTQVSKIACSGFAFDGIGSPIDGYWALGAGGLARVYADALSPEAVKAAFGEGAVPLLPMPLKSGTRTTEESEVVIATQGRALCATETAQMGDDGGTQTCFEQAAWPASFKASGGAAWSQLTVALTRK